MQGVAGFARIQPIPEPWAKESGLAAQEPQQFLADAMGELPGVGREGLAAWPAAGRAPGEMIVVELPFAGRKRWEEIPE